MKLGHIVGAAFAVAAWAFFPGCSKDTPSPELGIEGESCQQHTDCASGLQCLNGACSHSTVADSDAGVEAGALVVHSQAGESCGARIDCVVGLLCINNVCTTDTDPDAGDQTGAGKRGESCRSRGDCTAGLACVPSAGTTGGICAKADFGITPTTNECVQIDCVKAEDCCPKITIVDPSCTTYQSGCEGGITSYCTYYNMYCKCNPDAYTCTADNKCLSKTACTDAAFSCPSGFFCNGGTECVRCLKNEDCAADQMCTPQHTCLSKCSKNSDCPYLQTCSDTGACVDTGCADDRECIAKTRSPLSVCTGKKCKTPCQTDAECNIGGVYQYSACVVTGGTGFCQDVGCKTDEECRIRLNIPVPSNKQAKCQPKK